MRSLPRLLLAAFALGAFERPTANAQDIDPRTGLPNQAGVSVIANGTAPVAAPHGAYGAAVLPNTPYPSGGPVAVGDALGPGSGAQLTRFMPRVSASYLHGNGLGYRADGFMTMEAWVPLQVGDEHELMFADMRGILDTNSRVGANLGLGYRTYNREKDRVCGFYGYFDYKDTGVARYNQVSAGFESLGRDYDYRANIYIPVNDEVTTVSDVVDCLNPNIVGNLIFLTRRLEREAGMRGVDGEFGFPIDDRIRTKLFFGAYYFDGREVPQAYGVRSRLETQATDNIFLQLTLQTDTVSGADLWGGFTWTFPGPAKHYGEVDTLYRLNDAVMRNYNVVAGRDVLVTQEAASSTTTGQPLRIVFVDDNAPAGGDGTTEAPFNNFAQAQAGSLPGDIIFVRTGTYVGQSIVLQNDQRFLGDGIAAPVAGDPCLAGGYLVPATQCPDGFLLPSSRNPADRPNIVNAPGDAVALASRNEVGGFNIIGSGGSGIVGNGGQSFLIHDLTIAQSGGAGIDLQNMFGTGAIRNVISTQNGGPGIIVTSTTGTLTLDVRCVQATLNFGDGMQIASDNSNINATIFNSIFNQNFGNGLSATSTGGGDIAVDIESSQFVGNTVNGALLNAADGTVDATINNSNFNNNAGLGTSAGLLLLVGDGTAIPVSSGSSDVFISNSSFSNNEGAGIQGRIDGGGSTFDFTMLNSIADSNGFAGLQFNAQAGVNTFTLTNNLLSNNSRNGFAYDGFGPSSTTATFTNNFIVFNGADVFAPANLRDGVRLASFTTSPNALTATFNFNTIVNNGGLAAGVPRGHGVFISAFSIGTTPTGATVSFNGDDISNNQESGIRGMFGGGPDVANPLNVELSVSNFATIDNNGVDGVTVDTNQFASLLATFDDSFFRFNGFNGIALNNISLAAGEQPSLRTRIQRNVIDDNGTLVLPAPGASIFSLNEAGINIISAGRNANPNLININDNVSISRNTIGVLIGSSVRTATSITNHRNILNDDARIADNAAAGVVVFHAMTGGPVPQDRSEVHDVRINNNAISSPSEAIVLFVGGGSATPALGGGRMDAIVTQNLLFGPGFVPTIGLAIFGPPPPLFANRAIENARFLAVNDRPPLAGIGVRSYMRVRLEQNNVNDLQYNMVNAGVTPTAPGNTDGTLFDVASSAGTNTGFTNPILAPPFFGPNTGVYGFARAAGILDSLILPPPSTAFGAQFDPAQTNLTINVVLPGTIAPGPFPPPP